MFCSNCGNQVQPTASFCSSCGNSLNTSHHDLCNINIACKSQQFLVNSKISISIDNKMYNGVSSGEVFSLDLPSGMHHFLFSSGIRKSELSVNVQNDIQIELSWNRLSGKLISEVLG